MTNPRLAFVAGPLKDSVVELGDAEVSIGRDSTNTVRVADALLSRRHCVARLEGEGFRLFDLDSLNGTFVNGRPVREHALRHGDEISIGESRIVFLASDAEAPAQDSNPVELIERQMTARSTVRLKVADALVPPEEVGEDAQTLASVARDLTLLVKISTAINSVRGTEALQRELLRFVFEVVPAERGAILLLGEGGEVVSEFALEREDVRGEPMQVSRTVVRQVVEEGEAFLGNDLFEGSGALSTESLRASHISSLLCAPLVLFGRALGVIYLTAVDPSVHFDEDHLRLVSVISGLAAVS
ncbi:MAG TPA: FHA domain-containing protein, partial [Pyrinomonadaceae bacterium]|nr:FHA domain-containing protein [Pyrinomonadaceae bacterium]